MRNQDRLHLKTKLSLPTEYEFRGCLGTITGVLVMVGLTVLLLIGVHTLGKWMGVL